MDSLKSKCKILRAKRPKGHEMDENDDGKNKIAFIIIYIPNPLAQKFHIYENKKKCVYAAT